MEEYQIEIVRNKSFHELTNAQLEEMKDWFSSEEEFLDLKHLFVGVQSYKAANEKEQSSRKKELDELFVQVHSSKPSFNWKNFFFPAFRPLVLQPGFQLAFGMFFLVGIGYFLTNGISKPDNPIHAKKEKSIIKKVKEEKKSKEILFPTTVTANLNTLFEPPISIASLDSPSKLYVEDLNEIAEISNSSADYELTNGSSVSLTATSSETLSFSTNKNEGNKIKVASPIKPISEQPEILDLLFATY